MALGAVAETVSGTALAAWASTDPLAYPIANVVHLLGLVLLIGGIGLVDLRLIGAFRALPLRTLARSLTPLGLGGLALLAASGAILFAADPAVAESETFRTKLLLIAAALANAILFRFRYGAAPDEPVPTSARLLGATSLALWLSVAAFGRMIAYS